MEKTTENAVRILEEYTKITVKIAKRRRTRKTLPEDAVRRFSSLCKRRLEIGKRIVKALEFEMEAD